MRVSQKGIAPPGSFLIPPVSPAPKIFQTVCLLITLDIFPFTSYSQILSEVKDIQMQFTGCKSMGSNGGQCFRGGWRERRTA